MRVARLDLERFGRFTDVRLPFPHSQSDFHVIYGPNEAGKSTTRNALSELLFGFGMRTPYAFIHDYPDLKLGALLESADDSLEVVRLKRNKNSLVDEHGHPIEADRWRRLLGTTDRLFFERMFALDHEQLVRGGQDMLNSSTDVGQALFQAAAGLGHFSKVRADIGVEAAKWWTPRSRKDVQYYLARARVEEASRRLKEFSLSESALRTLQSARDYAQARADAASKRRVDAHARLTQLERIRRVAPKLQLLAAADADCATSAGDILLAADAREAFRSFQTDSASAQSAIQEHEQSIADQIGQHDALIVDDALLAHADEIDDLFANRSSVAKAVEDLPKRRVEREQLRRDIAEGLSDLGMAAMDPSEVLQKLLTAPQRERLRGLVDQHVEHERNLTSRRERTETAAGTMAALSAELGRLPDPGSTNWEELISDAADMLQSANARQLADGLVSAQASMQEAADALGWKGSAPALRDLTPPDPNAVAAQIATIAQHQEQLTDLKRSVREHDLRRVKVDAEIATRQTGAVPDASVLNEARRNRDDLIDELAAGTVTMNDQGDVVRQRIHRADEIADIRYAEAEAATKLDGLLIEQSGLHATSEAIAGRMHEHEQAIRSVREEWSRAQRDKGLPDLELETAATWSAGRLRLLKAIDEVARARAALDGFEVAAGREAEKLAAALESSRPADTASHTWLRSLLTQARNEQRQTTEQQGRRSELQRQIEEQQTLLTREQAAVKSYEKILQRWTDDWETACKAAGLPTDTLPRSLDRILSTIEALRTKVSNFTREQQARIEPMERDVAAYQERVRLCATRAAPDLTDDNAFEGIRTMADRLKKLRGAMQSRDELDKAIKGHESKLRIQRAKLAAAEAKLEPLLRAAGVTGPDLLDVAIAASDKRRTHELARASALRNVLDLGDGLDVEHLRGEVENIAVDQVEALLESTRMEQANAERDLEEARAEAVLVSDKLRQHEGSDSAARSRSMKAIAQRDMADAAEAFIGLQTQGLLLDWALNRYREEKQAPLLARASEYFSELTCGEHVRLLADGEGDSVTLSSRRSGPGSAKVPVDGMSDGTRDQLYLALRLAAVDLHLANNTALPFVADDLLVNFDDERTSAALKGLAILGLRTQTLYFTHHRHLVNLAKETLGEAVNVVEL